MSMFRYILSTIIAVAFFALSIQWAEAQEPPVSQQVISKNTDLESSSPGTDRMQDANRAASKVLKEQMRSKRPDDAKLLEQVDSAEIIVVSGKFDHVERVLGAIDIEHLNISPQQLDKIELNAKQLLMINCPGRLSTDGIEKVRKFVKAGGFLYTTDWALKFVLEKAFPGYVSFNGRKTGDDVVEVDVQKKDSAFLQHVKLADDKPKWWLEGSSYPIEIENEEKVDVLIESKEMKKRYGEAPIAVEFDYGDGKVLHIVSHFYLQRNELRNDNEKKSGEEWVEENASVSTEAAEEAKGVSAGDINSAYSSQQMTTNIVVERKKDQERIDKIYDNSVKRDVETDQGKVEDGTRVKVLEKKGDEAKVRTMSGDEYTIDADAL